jgi:hypothetical protein
MVEDEPMSNLGQLGGGRAQAIPMPPRGDTIARYATYLEAQRAVDYLSDQAFPVQAVTIVGTGLRMVERVTGRLTYSIVAVRSVLSGAYFGALVGLFLNLFTSASGSVILAGALFGAGFSVIFGLIAYSLTGGRRDFSSVSQVVATEYEVLCLPEQAGRAREFLGRLRAEGGPGPSWPSQTGPGQNGPGQNGPGQNAPGQNGPGPYGPPPPYQPPQPPPYGSPPPQYTPDERSARAAAGPGQPGPGELPEQPPVSGPTYSEMIDKQRRERLEREEAERRAEAEAARPAQPPAPASGGGAHVAPESEEPPREG